MENKIIGIAGMFLGGLLSSEICRGSRYGSAEGSVLFSFGILLLLLGIVTTDLPKIYKLITKGKKLFVDWRNNRDGRQQTLDNIAKRSKQPHANDAEAAAVE